ncbi:MAG: hypothetical protein AAF960_08285, partial [Bacteroidota bacterium]
HPLQKLTTKDGQQLELFLSSPFFNTSKTILSLFQQLQNNLKKGQLPNKLDLFHKVFGQSAAFNDHKIRLLFSDLLKLVEQFISISAFQKKRAQQQLDVAQFYRKNELEKHFNRIQRKGNKSLATQPYRNYEYYAAKSRFNWEVYELQSSKKRDMAIDLQEFGQDLDLAYFSQKLRQACFLRAQQALYNVEYDFEWVQQILEYIDSKQWWNVPAISLYYTAYQLASQPKKSSYFEDLKEKILLEGHYFPPEEIQDIYLLAINYCIKKVNNGQREYAIESLKLYKKGLEIGCFLENGFLSKFSYANIVAFGLMAKDFEWTETFINEYKNKLDKNARNSAYFFNLARLVYVQNRDHEAALQYLQKVSDKDLINTMNAKILQLRIYWEIRAFSLLESHLEAMANFIRRKALVGYHKENYLNIINATKRLLKVNFYNKNEVEKLKKTITEKSILSEKQWLLAQLAKLEG